MFYDLDRICSECGLTKGAHCAGHTRVDQCPMHEGEMDWNDTQPTYFRDSGESAQIPPGTPSKLHNPLDLSDHDL